MTPISAVMALIIAAAAPVAPYESRYDHLDIESILNNRRMVNYYAACLLAKGPCPPQGLDLKIILPEALHTNCAKCTEKQKTMAHRTIKRLRKEYPKIWDQLQAVWDPDDVYVRKFLGSFENEKPSPVVPLVSDRFGDSDDDAATNIAASSPPSPSTSTTIRTTLTTSTKATTKPSDVTKPSVATKPPYIATRPVATKPPYVSVTKPPQAPPFSSVGANIQATVTFVAELKKIVDQLYQLKLDTINRILSGR